RAQVRPARVWKLPVQRPGSNSVGCPRLAGAGANPFASPMGTTTAKALSLRYPQTARSGLLPRKTTHSSIGTSGLNSDLRVFVIVHWTSWPRFTVTETDERAASATVAAPLTQTICTA